MITKKPVYRTEIARVSELLAQSDTSTAHAIESYVVACELLEGSYTKANYGRVEDYLDLVVAESQTLGRPRNRATFFLMWRVGLALRGGRVQRPTLLDCTSRNEIQRLSPSVKPRRIKHTTVVWTTIRVSATVHRKLHTLARRGDTNINDVIVALLAK